MMVSVTQKKPSELRLLGFLISNLINISNINLNFQLTDY